MMISLENTPIDFVNQDNLTELLAPDLSGSDKSIHASLFMPLEWEPDKLQANHIRLKNLIRQAQQQLTATEFLTEDTDLPTMEEFFQPALELLRYGRLAVDHGRGLAIFLAPEAQHIYALPLPLEELVVVGPRFHIKPLLPMFSNDGRFYVLTLSQNQAQLWRGTQFTLEQVEAPSLPGGLDEALALEDPESSLQYHTSTGQGAERPAMFHGHDAEKEKKEAILRYCRVVNNAVDEKLAAEKAPLLLAAVDYLHAIYQEANSYPHLLAAGVSGNPDNLRPHELHEQAWQIVQKHFKQSTTTAVQEYQELAGTEKTSQTIDAILPAAAYGHVETLFIPIGRQKWGRFDPHSATAELGEPTIFDSEDLLNLTAVATLKNGGRVYAMQPAEMPEKADLAAIFRYTL